MCVVGRQVAQRAQDAGGRALGARERVVQDGDGLLLVAERGERDRRLLLCARLPERVHRICEQAEPRESSSVLEAHVAQRRQQQRPDRRAHAAEVGWRRLARGRGRELLELRERARLPACARRVEQRAPVERRHLHGPVTRRAQHESHEHHRLVLRRGGRRAGAVRAGARAQPRKVGGKERERLVER